jgi:hypothetical protein
VASPQEVSGDTGFEDTGFESAGSGDAGFCGIGLTTSDRDEQ